MRVADQQLVGRLAECEAYLTLSIEYGADIIRVHEVEMACDLVRLLGAKLGSD